MDVSDVNEALEAKRDREVLLGKDAPEAFVIDTAGDYYVSKPKKTPKIAEILANKSKVAPIGTRTRKKIISSAQKDHLMALAGRLTTLSTRDARLADEGVDTGMDLDLWLDAPEEQQSTKSALAKRKGPVKLGAADLEDITLAVHAGKSYNPSSESWKSLIEKVYAPEEEKEIERQALVAHQEKIQYLIETLKDDELKESSDEDDEQDAPANADDRYRISANAPTNDKRKNRTRRNKQARHKERMKLQAELREIKKKMKDLENLKVIEGEVTEKISRHMPELSRERTVHSYSKHDLSFKPIEVKLSDELTGDLRSLKPEGNLIYEQMYKLQATGQVESRVPQEIRRRYKEKFVTKDSHKV